MTDNEEDSLPSQEIATKFVEDILTDAVMQNRVNHIMVKVDEIYREIFKIKGADIFVYTCVFTEDHKIVFKATDRLTKISCYLPSIPISCLWDNTDLSIHMRLIASDIGDEFRKYKKERNEQLEKIPPKTRWDKFVDLFRW